MTYRSGTISALLLSLGLCCATAALAADPVPTREEQVRQEIRTQAERLKSRKGDASIFERMVAEGYAEFNPFFPFFVDPPKAVSVAMVEEFEAHDRNPASDRTHKIEKIQVYGDVALLTFTSISKGTPVGPGFMAQAKFLSVYVKVNGIWTLVQSHDARRAGPAGVPID